MKTGENKIYNEIRLVVKFCVFVLVIGAVIWIKTAIPKAEIHDGKIERSYEELLKYLEEVPKDIAARPYEAHMPKIVQKDIQTMLNSEEKVTIHYENVSQSCEIVIKRDDINKEKIQIIVLNYASGQKSVPVETLVDEISFYKKENHIVIYGKGDFFLRELITKDIPLAGNALTHYDNLDLIGTEYFNNYDNTWEWNKEMTLVRKDNEFKFFKLGVQQGSTIQFPGKIVEMNERYQYMIDDEKNLWYMAYSAVPTNPWVHFVKVAENISQVLNDSVVVWAGKKVNSTEFPIYSKNGKRYVGITNSQAFYLSNDKPIEKLDLRIETIELSEENVQYVEIQYMFYDWWANLVYDDSTKLVYEPKMIFEGFFDADPSNFPSTEEIKRFDRMTISLDKLDETVEELKKMYEKYEKK